MIPQALVERNRTALRTLGSSVGRLATSALPDLAELGQQEAGAAVRRLTVASIATVGTAATRTGAQSYAAFRDVALPTAGRFEPRTLTVDARVRAEGIIGAVMTRFAAGEIPVAQAIMAQALQREITNVVRETVAANADRDPVAVGYQRVPSPTACAFCLVVALNTYTSFEEDGGYHNACSCTTVPVFRGVGAYRPSYYDDFEEIYSDAATGREQTFEATNRTLTVIEAKPTLAAIRETTGRR